MGLLFSEPTGSGVTVPGAVLIQGDAIAEDGIVADMKANPDLATLIETVFARQPTGASGRAAGHRYLDKRGLELQAVNWDAVRELRGHAQERRG